MKQPVKEYHPTGIYLLKVNNRNTRTKCEKCSKLTIRALNFEHISHLVLVFLLLNLLLRIFKHVIAYYIMHEHNRNITKQIHFDFNPLQPRVAFLYPLKTSENLCFSDVFKRYRKATPGCNRLMAL